MSCLFDEIKDDVNCAIDNLCELFEDFQFHSKCGSYTEESISDLDEYENFIDSCSGYLDYDEFKKIIKNLTPITDGVKKSDFDWDELESRFDELSQKYKTYKNIKEEMENNELDPDKTEVLTQLDVEQGLIELAKNKGWIIEVEKDGEIVYIISKELSDLGFSI